MYALIKSINLYRSCNFSTPQQTLPRLLPSPTFTRSCNFWMFFFSVWGFLNFFVSIFRTQTFGVCVTYAYHVPGDCVVFVMYAKMTGVYCSSKPIVPLLQQYYNYYISLIHFNPIKWVKETYEINYHCVIRFVPTSCCVMFEL